MCRWQVVGGEEVSCGSSIKYGWSSARAKSTNNRSLKRVFRISQPSPSGEGWCRCRSWRVRIAAATIVVITTCPYGGAATHAVFHSGLDLVSFGWSAAGSTVVSWGHTEPVSMLAVLADFWCRGIVVVGRIAGCSC